MPQPPMRCAAETEMRPVRKCLLVHARVDRPRLLALEERRVGGGRVDAQGAGREEDARGGARRLHERRDGLLA